MIPLFEERLFGTDYRRRWGINVFALYLIACGWQVGYCVYPPLRED